MFGAYFKQARESAGMSPVEMASKIGYKSADSVYRIERNAAEPSWEQADKWAQACGKLIGDILPNSGGSSLDTIFQPLLAAMAGMDEAEMQEQVLILASQARLNRNAILKGRSLHTPTKGIPLPLSPNPAVLTETLLTNNSDRRGTTNASTAKGQR